MGNLLGAILKTTDTVGRSISFKQESNLIFIKIRQTNGEFVNQIEQIIDCNKLNDGHCDEVVTHKIREMNRSMNKKITG